MLFDEIQSKSSGVPVAFITLSADEFPILKLDEVRKYANQQVGDILDSPFWFILAGRPVGKGQEHQVRLELVAKETDSGEMYALGQRSYTILLTRNLKLQGELFRVPLQQRVKRKWGEDSSILSRNENEKRHDAAPVTEELDTGDSIHVGDSSTPAPERSSGNTANKRKFGISGFFSPKSAKTAKEKQSNTGGLASFSMMSSIASAPDDDIILIDDGRKENESQESSSSRVVYEEDIPVTGMDNISALARHAIATKGIKFYSKKEVESSEGQEQMYRRFWNMKVGQLTKAKSFGTWTKSELKGAIDVAWSLKRASLFSIEIRGLEAKITEMKDEWKERNFQFPDLKNAHKNEARMLSAAHTVQEADKVIRSISDQLRKACNMSKRDELRKELSAAQERMKGNYAELKKAQDALRKNMNSDRSKIEEIEKQIREDAIISSEADVADAPDINFEDIETFATEVKGDSFAFEEDSDSKDE